MGRRLEKTVRNKKEIENPNLKITVHVNAKYVNLSYKSFRRMMDLLNIRVNTGLIR